MTNDIAIQVVGLKKEYRLGSIGSRRLQDDLQSWWYKRTGREDPNTKIGSDERLRGQKFMALNGVDLTIYQGQKVGIIGTNGAGKSTLLKLLSRITAPTEGSIDIYGRISSMLEVGTGFHGEMTGRENIYMNGAILGMTKSEIDDKMDEIIDFSEISDFIDTPVKRYSSGMFVKLAFSVAAHLDSEIMVMDEVLAVGDMAFQQKCLSKMREAADKYGKTVLYVSHNMDTIRRLCNRVIVLSAGKIIFDGDVEEGIALYMNHGLEENLVDLDLHGKSDSNKNLGVSFEHLTLVDKTTPTYAVDEVLRIKLTISASKEFKNVRFRMTFRTDADVGLGSTWSNPFDIVSDNTTVLLSMPLSTIEKGSFYASIGLVLKDEIGRDILIDHITRAFKIEIIGLPLWNTNVYGMVRLIDMKAEII